MSLDRCQRITEIVRHRRHELVTCLTAASAAMRAVRSAAFAPTEHLLGPPPFDELPDLRANRFQRGQACRHRAAAAPAT